MLQSTTLVRELKRVLSLIRVEYGGGGRLRDLFVELFYIPAWLQSRLSGANPLIDGRPWLNYRVTRFIDKLIRPGMDVFEWGTGGSTCYFLSRQARLMSVENDPEWARMVEEHIAATFRDCEWTLRYIPGERKQFSDGGNFGSKQEVEQFRSRCPGQECVSFRHYAEVISSYPDSSFDIVLVDGRARPACLLLAIDKVRPGGYLVLDNSDRSHYRSAMAELNGTFKRKDFRGLCGYVAVITTTSVWHKAQSG